MKTEEIRDTIDHINKCTIDHINKCVYPHWGYAYLWRSHLEVAEKLKYRLRTLYGFSVDTEQKVVIVCDKQKEIFKSVFEGKNGNFNDYKDYCVFHDAWSMLGSKYKGYTTNYFD